MSNPATHINTKPKVDRAKRKLDFLEWSADKAREPEHKVGQTSGMRKRSVARRKLEFGETDPSVLLAITDELPNRDDPLKAMTQLKRRGQRTHFTYEQRTKLMEMFQCNEYPSRREKEALEVELGLTIRQIQDWFSNRRRRWRRQRPESSCSHGDTLDLCPLVTVKTPVPQINWLKVTRERAMQSHSTSAARAPYQPSTAVLPSATICIPDFSQYPPSTGSCFVPPFRPRFPPFPGRSCNGALETPDFPKTPGFCEFPGPVTTSDNRSHVLPRFPFSYSTALELSHIFAGLEDGDLWSTPPTPSFDGF